MVQMSTGDQGPFLMEWLNPSSPREILVRMLNNLRNIYLHQEIWEPAIAVIEHLRTAQPDLPYHLRDLGLVHYRKGSRRRSAHFLEAYLRRAPDAPDATQVKRSLKVVVSELSRLN